MVVLKKTNQDENFSYDKLFLSIQSANTDTDEPLDIELVMAEFQNIVVDKEYITSGQINVIVYGLLYSKNAPETLKNYSEFKDL